MGDAGMEQDGWAWGILLVHHLRGLSAGQRCPNSRRQRVTSSEVTAKEDGRAGIIQEVAITTAERT